jgi:Sel1 repeat
VGRHLVQLQIGLEQRWRRGVVLASLALVGLLFAAAGSAAATTSAATRANDGQPVTATAMIVAGGFGQAADGQEAVNPAKGGGKKKPRLTDEEVEQLTAEAEGGDAEAQYKLGMVYHNGRGKDHPRDYDQAMKWLRMAADQGNVLAEDWVGTMYYRGEGVPQDYLEAVKWYRMAAEKGNGHAQWQLVDMYQKGIGVPRDLAESKKWAQLGRKPDRSVLIARLSFAVAVMAGVAFAMGLFALQFGKLSGWRKYGVALFVHVGGAFLVINSLITYGFWIVVPHCQFGFLAPSCTQFTDAHTRSIVNWFANYAMVNLIFRFMMVVGLAMDALAVWYAVYLVRLVLKWKRGPQARPVAARATS